MQPPVLFFQSKIVLYLIILNIYAASDLIGYPKKFRAMKPVVIKQKPQCQTLEDKETKEGEITANEKKYVTQRSKLSHNKRIPVITLKCNACSANYTFERVISYMHRQLDLIA